MRVEQAPEVVLYGRLLADQSFVRKQLSYLLTAETDYHGTLQVTRSALERMAANTVELIRSFHERNQAAFDATEEPAPASFAPAVPSPSASATPRKARKDAGPKRATVAPPVTENGAGKPLTIRQRILDLLKERPNDPAGVTAALAKQGITGIDVSQHLYLAKRDGMITLDPEDGMYSLKGGK